MTNAPDSHFIPFRSEEIETSIPARFAAQVRIHPTRLAVKFREQSLTYQELDRVSNQVAHALLERGSDPQARVALLVDQGVELIAAIFGVLKAGCIYVPMEAGFPKRRLEHLLRDAEATYLIVGSNNTDVAEQLACRGCEAVHFDHLRATAPSHHVDFSSHAELLAYIYYTSGSTGEPKGVTDNHRNVLHNLMRYTNGLHFTRRDRFSLIQSCSFSGCVSTMFGALLNGAGLFPFDLQAEGAHRLAEWVRRERITVFHSVPMLFRQLTSSGGSFDSVRLVRLEGDRADWQDVELFRRDFGPSSVLVNGLGTTETGIVRRFSVDQHTHLSTGPLPVGDPVEDMQVTVLDDDCRVAGCGEIGEIAVRSRYLAVGYWRRPDLTTAAFSINDAERGVRSYRTGDLGRLGPDGCLEYLGRKDLQAKIRGAWADVSGAEQALRETGLFDEVLVATRDDARGDPQLVAYLVPARQTPIPSTSSIRRLLGQTLPAADIPTAYVMLDALPLTPHGKIDRRALPSPVPSRRQLDVEYTAPRTPVEQAVAAIWQEVLGVDAVGVKDNFFELGGHSLLASQVLARIESQWGLGLSLKSFFDAPTLAQLALEVTQQLASRASEAELQRMLDEGEE